MSAKNTTIKTVGELRQFLVQAMVEVKSGDMQPDSASRITKLAAQVNESFYSEVKIARVAREAGLVAAETGALHIGQVIG